MARFATDIITKMNRLTADLAESLGEGTTDLALRVGLHSGPVTAGVLRGQKSRFQLFGDTVNTASRMESNGVPGRIHISSETATELTRHGKSGWLTERPDKITAKGKGEMTTFWVNTRTGRSSAASRLTDEGDQNDSDFLRKELPSPVPGESGGGMMLTSASDLDYNQSKDLNHLTGMSGLQDDPDDPYDPETLDELMLRSVTKLTGVAPPRLPYSP